MTYRDFLPPHYRKPLSIERTMKRGGQLVLTLGEIKTVPGRPGAFAGKRI